MRAVIYPVNGFVRTATPLTDYTFHFSADEELVSSCDNSFLRWIKAAILCTSVINVEG